MTDDKTVQVDRKGDDTRAWNSREEEAKHVAKAFVGQVLGGYHIVREIGHGSMGIVFFGEHTESGHQAAVKVLPPSLSITTTVIKRFLREAESVKKLNHESIVKIYSVGEENGIHFYAMQFIAGASLDRVLRQRKLSVRECAAIGAEAARALFFAHEAEIIHRDIKPGNIILTHKDRPVITDFGLAKPEKAATLTESGALVGTPIYMSPEQVRADKTLIDRRTDIYSLGITLYEMLAGSTPFEGNSTQEILNKIESVDPAPLRKVRPDVPKPLETICHKAIEKDPSRRYQTAIELALDLERFLKGEPIQARPSSLGSRLIRKVKRHPTVSALSAALVIAVIGFVVITVLNQDAIEQKHEAQETARLAQFNQRMTDGENEFTSGRPSAAIVSYTEAVGLMPDRPEPHVERGRCHIQLSSYEKAIAEFDTALKLDPTYRRAKLHRGIAKWRDGTREQKLEGIEDIKATLDIHVDDPEAAFESARLCLEMAQSAGSPSSRDMFINTADKRLQLLLDSIQRDTQEAVKRGQEPRLLITESQAFVLQGHVYEEQGMAEEALVNYKRALELDRNNVQARALVQASMQRALDPKPQEGEQENPAATSTWFGVLAKEGLDWAKVKLESDPDILRRAADALNVFKSSNDSTTATPTPDKTAEKIDSELVKAEKAWLEGNQEAAVAIYERVLELMPDLVEPWCRLAEHYLRDPNELDKAVKYSDAALRINPTNAYSLSVAIQVHAKKGNAKTVKDLAERITRFHPSLLSKPEVHTAIQGYVETGAPAPTPAPTGKDDGSEHF